MCDELSRQLAALAALPEPGDNGDAAAELAAVNAASPAPEPEPPADAGLILSPTDPRPSARAFIGRHHSHPFGPLLLFVNGELVRWNGRHYAKVERAAIRAAVGEFAESAKKYATKGGGKNATCELVRFAPTTNSVNNIVDAVECMSYSDAVAPAWLDDGAGRPPADEILCVPSGLLHLPKDGAARIVEPNTPRFFSLGSLEFDFNAKAPPPRKWLAFLESLFANDAEPVALLQEWMGYSLLPMTHLQRILLIHGPTRAGKGVICRTWARLLGADNVCGPTLGSLAERFGLWPMMGKTLAIISDARLSGRADQSTVVERLLSISGEDRLTIDLKGREPITAQIKARVVIVTNELPKLLDTSGAMAGRFCILTLTKSFFGAENTALADELATELPSILRWAIDGLQRLRRQGRFTEPQASKDALAELGELASPISAFLADTCSVAPNATVTVADMFDAWCWWCTTQGRHTGNVAGFGRDLRATNPLIHVRQRRDDGERERYYDGATLTAAGRQSMEIWRAEKASRSG